MITNNFLGHILKLGDRPVPPNKRQEEKLKVWRQGKSCRCHLPYKKLVEAVEQIEEVVEQGVHYYWSINQPFGPEGQMTGVRQVHRLDPAQSQHRPCAAKAPCT